MLRIESFIVVFPPYNQFLSSRDEYPNAVLQTIDKEFDKDEANFKNLERAVRGFSKNTIAFVQQLQVKQGEVWQHRVARGITLVYGMEQHKRL